MDLERFVVAQRDEYARVVGELRNGVKVGHWMWFIFPQVSGLGRSDTSRHFGISSLEEARAYLEHPTLGARLRECTALVMSIPDRALIDIFGSTDALKFRSSMTLFSLVATDDPVFGAALEKFCEGQPDQSTIRLLRKSSPA